ncbi:MAG: HAD family hydrolase [Epsilonproteobacteria bacterium]|nr:HAD family hydrolase [Campylobacterota bacterium]
MLRDKKALLLDMNSTFMFGEDRFSIDEDFSIYYKALGGTLSDKEINEVIRVIYDYLGDLYPKEVYREDFPTLEQGIEKFFKDRFTQEEVEKIIKTFSFHERGHIPQAYVEALYTLNQYFVLSVVIDIWAPKEMWIEEFKSYGLDQLFIASSFSSECGMVKPSPKPFEQVVKQLGLQREACVVIGDSIRRDLGGATQAGIDCILVGGQKDKKALACFESLLTFRDQVLKECKKREGLKFP